MSGRGWFRAYRKVFDPAHPLRMRQPLCPIAAWLDVVGMASHEPIVRGVGLEVVELQRGELLASIRFLATRWKWSKSRVERVLDVWRKRSMLRAKTETPVGTVYVVVSYDTYNPREDGIGDRSGDSRGTAAGQPRDTTEDKEKNSKNRKNKKNGEAQKRASALPEDWKPSEQHAAYARKHGLKLDDEADAFRDHAEANGRKLVSWDAGFRSWLRKARDFKPKGKGYANVSEGSQAAAVLGAGSDELAKRRAERDREAEQERVDAAIRKWEADHPEQAKALERECTKGCGHDPIKRAAARIAYRGKILAEIAA